MINTGATTEMTKKKYEKKSATFLITVVLFPSMIFMMEKKVKSKYTSMKNLRYTLNLNQPNLLEMNSPELQTIIQNDYLEDRHAEDRMNMNRLAITTRTNRIKMFMSD